MALAADGRRESRIWPPPRPVMPTVTNALSRAARSAPSTLGERPEVEMATRTSPARTDGVDLARKQLLVAVVVADRGQDRGIGGQRKGGQPRAIVSEAADEFAREVLRIGGAAAVAGEQQLVAAAKRVNACLRRGRDRRCRWRSPAMASRLSAVSPSCRSIDAVSRSSIPRFRTW